MKDNTMNFPPIRAIILALISLSLSACSNSHGEEQHAEGHKIVATIPQVKDVTLTQQYVCQIHSKRHVNVCALEMGYLEAITIKEGQSVKANDPLFKVRPILYEKKAEAEQAEAHLAQLEYEYTKSLHEKKVVSENEVNLLGAKRDKAAAKADLAQAELAFATVNAPFDGIVDRLRHQQGSLVREGEILSTLSDNSVMWVYFNVPEARYLEYMATPDEEKANLKIELVLANGSKFQYASTGLTVEADFNNETGNIPFRADFPNPEIDDRGSRLLRHGQTGTILISRVQKDSLVIPQRATFEILQKRYVFVVDKDDVVHQREIVIQNELDDIFVLKDGIAANETIVLEGTRQVRDGDKVEYEKRQPEEAVAQLKQHAE